jgi:hypothetical protein
MVARKSVAGREKIEKRARAFDRSRDEEEKEAHQDRYFLQGRALEHNK